MKMRIACFLAVLVYCFMPPMAAHAQSWGVTANVFGDAPNDANKHIKIGITTDKTNDPQGFPPEGSLRDYEVTITVTGKDNATGAAFPLFAYTGSHFLLDTAYDQPPDRGYSWDCDMTTVNTEVFGDAEQVTVDTEAGGGSAVSTYKNPLYCAGATVVEVAQTADGKTFAPCPGAVVSFGGIKQTVKQVGTKTFLIFGHDPTGAVTADYSYPSGPANSNYSASATWNGQSSNTMVEAGTAWPSTDCLLLVSTPGSNYTPTSGTYPTGQLPTGTTAANANGSGAAAGSGAGSPIDLSSFTDFVKNFWDKLKQFFSDELVPPAADRDALAEAFSGLVNSGPGALIPSLLRELQTLQGSAMGYVPAPSGPTGQDGGQPYWSWSTFPQNAPVASADSNGPGSPSGYDVGADPEIVHAPTVYEQPGYLPQWIDLSPFKRELLWLRRFIFVSTWFLFVQRALNELTPKFRI